MVAVWSHSMDKRPGDRTEDDLESIYGRLRSIKAFHRLHPVLLQQLCFYGYYEDLDRGVTLFRQGDRGSNWYTVLAGSLDVQVTHTGHSKSVRATRSPQQGGRSDAYDTTCLHLPDRAAVSSAANECRHLFCSSHRSSRPRRACVPHRSRSFGNAKCLRPIVPPRARETPVPRCGCSNFADAVMAPAVAY
ncbi:hypothetical protein MRX96_043845 [Rhipicephalus microplus]